MSHHEFMVFTGGDRLTLHVSDQGVVLGDGPDTTELAWGDVIDFTLPNSFSAALTTGAGSVLQVAFSSRADRDRFTQLAGELRVAGVAEAQASRRAARTTDFPMLTIQNVPGRQITASHGLVTAQSVMSRNVFSDMSSDLKSVVGGNLKGVERALAEAITAVQLELAVRARSVGADAVVGVSVAIAGLGEKAEAVVISGTAVSTRPEPSAAA